MYTKEQILKVAGLTEQAVSAIYLFGSRVYGNISEQSDYDYVIVGKGLKYREVSEGDINIHILSDHLFQANLDDFDMRALECALAPKEAKILEKNKHKFKIKDKGKFRDKILFQVNKNWRLAKKKLEEGDVYGGKKRIYHTLRIFKFADDLVTKNKIKDWGAATDLYKEVMEDEHTDWAHFRDKYTAQKTIAEKKFLKSTT